jgi:hypothetical protein
MTGYRLIGCRSGSMCPCGARTRDGTGTCAKCNSRARWERRKTRRAFGDGLPADYPTRIVLLLGREVIA